MPAKVPVLIAFAVGIAALLGCAGRAPSERTEAVTLKADDGVAIAATYRASAAQNAPGVVLIHSLGADRRRWDVFAERLRRAGYASIAIDMRGHGESLRRGDATLDYRKFSAADWLGVTRDIDSAKRALVARGALADNVILIGASIGANLALRYAAAHAEIPAVVLISPGLDYHGVETEQEIVNYGDRPSLLMTSDGDSYSASSCAALKTRASGQCELRQYPGAAHGVDLLDASEAAGDQILAWLKEIAPVNARIAH